MNVLSLRFRMSHFAVFFVFQIFKLAHKGFEILEFSVYRGKADVCHVVDIFQLIHDQNADMLGGYLAVQGILKLGFDIACDLFHLFCGNGAFIAGLHNARKKLASVKHLSCVVFFNDHQRKAFHNFIGGEALLTG